MNGSNHVKNGDRLIDGHSGVYSKAAVATDNADCSAVGKEILKKGGSAVDAAISAMLCVGIQNVHSVGLGGGLVMSVYDAATGESYFFNSLSKSSSAAYERVYGSEEETFYKVLKGATAVSLPGDVAAFWDAHQLYGRLEWKELFGPAIKMASEGIRIQPALSAAIEKRAQHVADSPCLRELFMNPDGSYKKEGDILKMPKLAKTLQKVAEKGRQTFYEGEVAAMILDDLKGHPHGDSLLSEDDFRKYKTDIEPLQEVDVGHLTFLVPGLTSGGPLTMHILKILEGFDFGPHSIKDRSSKLLTCHRVLEAFKAAYLQRIHLGDPKHDRSVLKTANQMLSDEFCEKQRNRIDDSIAGSSLQYGVDLSPFFPPDDQGTSHISVLDERGNAVSVTSTINYYFGCKIVGRSTGIIFNNGMKNFSVWSPKSQELPSKATFPIQVPRNNIAPNKRALSSMSPIIILDKNLPPEDKVQMVIGASGGVRIPTAVTWVLMNHLWFKKDISSSITAPRLHCRVGRRLELQLEEELPEEIIEGLVDQKQHTISPVPYGKPGTVVQAISKIRGNGIVAASDPRKFGIPDGY